MRINTAISASIMIAIIMMPPIFLGSHAMILPGSSPIPMFHIFNNVAYEPHDPIVITHVAAFTILGFNGSGTKEDPFVIEGYSINTDDTCIDISNVNAHFVIRGCLLTSTSSQKGWGVKFDNVVTGRVESCEIESKEIGVKMEWSYDCAILGNTIRSCSNRGLDSYQCYDSIIGNNSFYDNGWDGMNMHVCENCTATSNTIYYNGWNGISVSASTNCTINGNEIFDNHGCAVSLSSKTCTLLDNVMINNGVRMYLSGNLDQWKHNISGNTVNDLPLAYFWAINDTTVEANLYGQIIAANCQNLTITSGHFYGASVCVTLGHCTNCEVSDITQEGGLVGLAAVQSRFCFFNNITLIGFRWEGIWLYSVVDCNITDNQVTNGNLGMSMQYNERCIVENNTVTDCGYYGIYLSSGADNIITNNRFAMNGGGIGFSNEHNNMVQDNRVQGNQEDGIYIQYSDFSRVYNNTVIDNFHYGIWNGPGTGNSVFVNNTVGWNSESNAFDEGTDSIWDDNVSQGNHWGDYGCNLSQYLVPGPAGSVDRYPSKADQTAPIINSPSDIQFERGAPSGPLTWMPIDERPGNYTILWNDTQFLFGSWDGSEVSLTSTTLEGLEPGAHNFTLVVADTSANHAQDTVIVTVTPDITAPIVNGSTDIEYIQGTTGHAITWSLYDHNPSLYNVYRNGTLIESGVWSTDIEDVMVVVDGLTEGFHNFTIHVLDVVQHQGMDTIWVIVTAPATTTSTSTTTSSPTNATTPANSDTILEFSTVVTVTAIWTVVIAVALACRSHKRRN